VKIAKQKQNVAVDDNILAAGALAHNDNDNKANKTTIEIIFRQKKVFNRWQASILRK
jgi:hypothetical protein